MFRRRYREKRVRTQRSIVDKWTMVIRGQRASCLIEPHGPVKWLDLRIAPRIRSQIVDNVSAAYDQHILVAERRQFFAKFMMEAGRPVAVDRELNDGDISVGMNMAQHGPRSVIEPPTAAVRNGSAVQEI